MCWIQNFSKHVTCNMACWIDRNGTVHTLKSESLLSFSVLQWETYCILLIEWLSGLWGVSKLFLGQKMGRSKKKIAAWRLKPTTQPPVRHSDPGYPLRRGREGRLRTPKPMRDKGMGALFKKSWRSHTVSVPIGPCCVMILVSGNLWTRIRITSLTLKQRLCCWSKVGRELIVSVGIKRAWGSSRHCPRTPQ